ncbi:hypothetical protein DPMN_094173 [Dreissena polymorpha]|uniref:Uncharacterized protein n=1 Tax=Dreissena polymorpha TaxID=45954 RepID=A0A9D4L5L6_DREPO|nr:hypothetical protein DPMN_094173 [Dreissena polymorpha]
MRGFNIDEELVSFKKSTETPAAQCFSTDSSGVLRDISGRLSGISALSRHVPLIHGQIMQNTP